MSAVLRVPCHDYFQAAVSFTTWQTPLVKSLKSECSCLQRWMSLRDFCSRFSLECGVQRLGVGVGGAKICDSVPEGTGFTQ